MKKLYLFISWHKPSQPMCSVFINKTSEFLDELLQTNTCLTVKQDFFFDMWLPNNILKTHICKKAAVILYKYLDSALSASTSSFLLLFLSSDYGFNKLSSIFQEIPLLLQSYQLLPPWQPAPCLESCLRFILAFPLPSNLNTICFSRKIPLISWRDVIIPGFTRVVLSF